MKGDCMIQPVKKLSKLCPNLYFRHERKKVRKQETITIFICITALLLNVVLAYGQSQIFSG